MKTRLIEACIDCVGNVYIRNQNRGCLSRVCVDAKRIFSDIVDIMQVGKTYTIEVKISSLPVLSKTDGVTLHRDGAFWGLSKNNYRTSLTGAHERILNISLKYGGFNPYHIFKRRVTATVISVTE